MSITRISSQTANNMATAAMSGAYSKYASIIQKIADNKNFTKISENVPDAVSLMKIKNQMSEIDGYQSNIQHAVNEMNLVYDTLGSVNDELSAINGLVLSAANAPTTPDAAKAYAAEIEERVETVKNLMNTQYLDNYIFSGTFVNEQTYTTDPETGEVIYNGSPAKVPGERNLTISADTKFSYNFTGEEIFGEQDGVNDFFAQMKDLVDKLYAADDNQEVDYDAIREKLKIIDTASRNIAQTDGVVSAKVSKLLATQEINEDTLVNLTEKRTDIEEVDIIKAASDLASARTGLQASYALGTSVLSSVSLLDYI